MKNIFLKNILEIILEKKIISLNPKSKDRQKLQRDLLPSYYVNSENFKNVFGDNQFDLKIQGMIELKTGISYQSIENPQIPLDNQSNFNLDFDQQIATSVNASIGEKLQINANYDTQATFDFQNIFRINFNPNKKINDDDAILQDIDIGNISINTSNNLMRGAQNLFGVKTKLKFGNTYITGIFSRQKSQTKTIIAKAGITLSTFNLKVSNYEDQRHFFIAHYFRNHYKEALKNLPLINNLVNIHRIEIWVTNTRSDTKNTRNIVALADLGESGTDIYDSSVSNISNQLVKQNANALEYTQNQNNSLQNILKNPSIRQRKNIKNALPTNFKQGKDYVFLNNARKLKQNEYSLNDKLGILSLHQKLLEGTVLAVAFEYSVLGDSKIYKVGEFATDVNNSSENIVTKLLKSNALDSQTRLWDLMMKNVYSLGSHHLKQEDFRLDILYKDDQTGVTTNTLQRVKDTNIAKKTLLHLTNVDVLNHNFFKKTGGDGHFDFLENITIDSKNGRIFFPVLEPFGRDLENKIGSENSQYIFKELYTKMQSVVKNDYQNKDKYFLKGHYKSDFKEGISLGVLNVDRGSVRVTSNGILLKEGIDYSVDYMAGRVKIINPNITSSGNPIQVSLENQSIFENNNKTFMGLDIVHKFSNKLLVSGTYLNVSERPISSKVTLGQVPINNSMYGASFQYNDTIRFVTDWFNKLPFTNSKKPTTLNIRGDFAYLKPNVNSKTDVQGESTIYIDDFEDAQTPIDISNFRAWKLSSKPLNFRDKKGTFYDFGSENTNDLDYGKNRAKLAWYSIDRLFYENSSLKPAHIDNKALSRVEINPVFHSELFPNAELDDAQNPLINTFDLAYYPKERGSYNYDNQLDSNGFLTNPEKRWAGITRSLPVINFQENNITYIQFWLQNPYTHYSITEKEGAAKDEKPIKQGTLFLNLGNISEDILKDNEKQYENGLPAYGENPTDIKSAWGNLPSSPKNLYAFDENENNRALQDVGLDGLNDSQEKEKFPDFKNDNDPSADNYHFFRGDDYDQMQASILRRYKDYNNTQGNSSIGNLNKENYPTAATVFPDAEDIDKDQTMNTLNAYYQYKISLSEQDLILGKNYIVDTKETLRKNPDGSSQKMTWYQFRIPIQSGTAINNISNWNNINFMRMFLTNCKTPVVLRFATLELIRSNWMRYEKNLHDGNSTQKDNLDKIQKQNFYVGAVSIEENESRKPIAYVLPPNINRERLREISSVQSQNEQSLSIKVKDLPFNQTRAVYKNVNIDLRMYEKLKLFLHAEALPDNNVKDHQIAAILRMGSDLTEHFYQIEIPLKITPKNATTPQEIWLEENEINVVLKDLANLKIERFEKKLTHNVIFSSIKNTSKKQKISVKGFPNLSNIKVISLGIRNTDRNPHSIEVWLNELRVAGFGENKGSWAAILNTNANIADIANVDFNTQIQTNGFGDIQQNINQRNQFSTKQYALSTHLNIERFLPEKWKLRIPMNYNLSEVFKTPKYDAMFEDLLFEETKNINPNHANSLDYTLRKSINFINIGKNKNRTQKPHFYDLENFTGSYSYNETFYKNYKIKWQMEQNFNTSLHYNYTFNNKPIKPFSKFDFLEKNRYLKWIKGFYFNVLPTTLSINGRISRSFYERKSRNLIEGLSDLPALQKRNFLFNWDYALGYRILEGLNILFKANNYRIYDDFEKDETLAKQIHIFSNLLERGRMKNYHQNLKITYSLPFSKMPFLNFINANYSYDANFNWQSANPMLLEKIGHTLKNSNTHQWNVLVNLQRLYFNMGLNSKKNILYDLATMFKNIRVNLSENNGIELDGFKNNVHFLGVHRKDLNLSPYLRFAFGNQIDIRDFALRNNDLITRNINRYNQKDDSFYNKNYRKNNYQKLEIELNVRPLKNLNILISTHKTQTEHFSQRLDAVLNHQNQKNQDKYLSYFTPTPVISSGNFSMTYNMLASFGKSSDENFRTFLNNRKSIQQKLAKQTGLDIEGFGINSSQVLIPAFRAAYTNTSVNDEQTSFFPKIPKLNWQIVYSGLTNIDWIKKYFSNIIISHRYKSTYSINNFQNNVHYKLLENGVPSKNGNGYYHSEKIILNILLNDSFSPLIKLTLGFKNNITLNMQMNSSRSLHLNLNNDLLSDTKQTSYILGLGYHLRDVKMRMNLGSYKKVFKGDINFKADVNYKRDITLIRNIQTQSTQITGGQSVFSVRFLASYNLNKNLNASLYYNHLHNEYAISTAFPNTSINAGIGIIYRLEN